MSELTKQTNELLTVVSEFGVTTESKARIVKVFTPFFEDLKPLLEKSDEIKVKNEFDTIAIDRAKRFRLNVRAVRKASEKAKTAEKKDALEYGKAVQGVYNHILEIATNLEEKAKYEEELPLREEKKRQDELHNTRKDELGDLLNFQEEYVYLGEMNKVEYEDFVSGLKEKEAEFKTEQDRIAEINRIGELNDTRRVELTDYVSLIEGFWTTNFGEMSDKEYSELVKEIKAKDAKIKAEQEKQAQERADKAAKEAEERVKEQAKLDAERLAATKADVTGPANTIPEVEAMRQRSGADMKIIVPQFGGDKDILISLSVILKNIEVPKLENPVHQKIANNVLGLLKKTYVWLDEKIEGIE